MTEERRKFATRSIHAGEAPDRATGARGVPIHQSATFAFDSYDQIRSWEDGHEPHFQYSRESNPTVQTLEAKIADLEGGEATIATNSGMAAISAVLLHFAANGGHIIASSQLFGATGDFLENEISALGGSITRLDLRDLSAVERAIRPETRLIHCESVSNPLLHVADVPALAELAHRHGAALSVDNTFLSPVLYRPIEDGVDLVIHSATKYLSGSGQTVGGVVTGRSELIEPIRKHVFRLGTYMQPFTAWLIIMGCKTVSLRVDRHLENTQRLAELLEDHPAVAQVNYPGLPSNDGHTTLQRMNGGQAGGLLSFRLHDDPDTTRAFIDALELCTVAVSLGEPLTLIWPYRDGLIRLAVGLEDSDDLAHDLTLGLEAAQRVIDSVRSTR
ncbi:MAG: aminotransferase class I/II-fold pyridoxal phosphate-dependent enzyme [Thermomicrobiales bacterium]|nr:aminotransferase class I/II-fold pyridoxal phosphate-dependent enzyme [Thermomicrobiales bacterium]